MTRQGRKFLLDANVLIAAHRAYYAFDLCPGFWASLKAGHEAGRIFSTHRVRAELEQGGDALAAWVAAELPEAFFLDDSATVIVAEYAPMMVWVTSRSYSQAAQAKFATDADGWLIATAKQAGFCLVTHEARQDGARARVPMPNVCDEFGVSYCNTFEMLRELSCSFR